MRLHPPHHPPRRLSLRLPPKLVVLPVALALLAGGGALAQEATFRSGTRIVPVLTTVIDAQGRLVPNLEQEQFTILDNGKPQQVTFFLNEVQPFTVVVILDFSASMTASLDRLKDATEQFLLRMLPADKGQVGAFSDKIQFSGTFTNDRDDLIGALGELQFGNPTRLYDAIDESIQLLEGVEGRKVVLAFTDGDDTASRRGMGAVLDHAKAEEIMIYAIGLESEFFVGPGRMQRTRPDRGLRKLAEDTGGGYFELKKTDDLAPTFTRVAQELHSLYTLGFSPPNLDGKEHKLEVRLKQAGQSARARRSYVASPERLSDAK
jgi:Ca-activated chloride channel family protein